MLEKIEYTIFPGLFHSKYKDGKILLKNGDLKELTTDKIKVEGKLLSSFENFIIRYMLALMLSLALMPGYFDLIGIMIGIIVFFILSKFKKYFYYISLFFFFLLFVFAIIGFMGTITKTGLLYDIKFILLYSVRFGASIALVSFLIDDYFINKGNNYVFAKEISIYFRNHNTKGNKSKNKFLIIFLWLCFALFVGLFGDSKIYVFFNVVVLSLIALFHYKIKRV